ncbi:4-phosphopantetheinyl transferase family protein, partial [Pseudomonas sp. BGM005]|nr:4-phosphopantetheinyl transferase family protein [Pseudomonas sp. BG5]
DGLVAVAVTSGCERIGIDCERADAEIEAAALGSYCSPDERRWLDQAPAGQAPRAAVAFWALKESHLKALGVGLRQDPRSVAFSWQD